MTEKESKIVCVDLDGMIVEYDEWRGSDHFGDVRPNARWGLLELIDCDITNTITIKEIKERVKTVRINIGMS